MGNTNNKMIMHCDNYKKNFDLLTKNFILDKLDRAKHIVWVPVYIIPLFVKKKVTHLAFFLPMLD